MNKMSIEQISIANKRELEEMVVKDIESIEGGLTTIGNQIPINGHTKLDVLCHDKNGQLVVFKLSPSEDDTMLFEGLGTLNQLDTVKHILKFHYQNFKINEKEPSRLVLIAPSFSKNLLTIAKHISGMRIDLYEWEYLKFGDKKGLRIKPISISKETEEKRKSKRKEQKEKPSTKVEKQQTPQEVAAEPEFDLGVSAKPEKPQEPEKSAKPVSWVNEKKKEKTKKKSKWNF
jgi:RecB family endonuclease NucS